MKCSVILLVLGLAALAEAVGVGYPRGCIYVNGRCTKGCPVGTHGYSVGCGVVTPEATCTNPNPVPGNRATSPVICDFSACYCDAPTVRNEDTRECVSIEDCPKNN